MLILFAIPATIALIFLIGRRFLSNHFDNEMKMLFAQSQPVSDKRFNYSQLDGLPEPVQRYFKHVLKNGQLYIKLVALTHGGQFKMGLDKEWVDIKGEQYFTTAKPGFLWKGSTRMFTAFDSYINNSGRLMAWVLSCIKVADSKGGNFNEGELQRWLAESVWFPTNLLPNKWLLWSAIDAQTAKLSFKYKDVSFSFSVLFNEIGEIVQMETQRFMSKNKRERWVCQFSDYQIRNEVVAPMFGEVSWGLEHGAFSYARFNVKTIRYDWINR